MPEGDTLYKIASRLDAIARGELILEAESPLPRLEGRELAGKVVSRVEARGKHLLIHFDDARVLHTHLRREGSWHIIAQGAPWPKSRRRLSVGLHLQTHTLAGFNLPVLEVLSRAELLTHPHLSALGPDLLSPEVNLEEVLRRLRRHPTRAIAEALMDQRNCAGIGNVYKSELLFMQRIHPLSAIAALSDETLEELLRVALKWMRRNLLAGPRRTRWGAQANHWVYGRAGERCAVCDGTITRLRQGKQNRSTYLCVRCQPPPGPEALSEPSSLLRRY